MHLHGPSCSYFLEHSLSIDTKIDSLSGVLISCRYIPLMLAEKGDNNAMALVMMMDKNLDDIDPMMLLLFNGKDNSNLSTYLLMQMMKKNN